MIKFSRDMEWTAPFVESARKFVPVDLLVSVKGFRSSSNSGLIGSCFKEPRNKYSITLLSYSKYDQKYKARRIEDVLFALAHELTHMVHWDRHDEFFAKTLGDILSAFFGQLEFNRITDIQARHDTIKTERKE